MNTITLPKVGDKCKAIHIPSVTGLPNREWTDGYIFTVNEVREDHDYYDSGERKNTPVVFGDFVAPDGCTINYYVSEWEPVDPPASTPVDTPVDKPVDKYAVLPTDTPDVATLKNVITGLIAASERDNLALEQERTDKRNWERFAISVITRTDEEAVARDWCSVYDGIRDEFIAAAPYDPGFPVYGTREYTVTWTEYVSISVDRSLVVKARDVQDAIEQARYSDTETEDVIEAVHSGSWEVTDSDRYEAEEY